MHETCLIIIHDPGMRPGPEALFEHPASIGLNGTETCVPSFFCGGHNTMCAKDYFGVIPSLNKQSSFLSCFNAHAICLKNPWDVDRVQYFAPDFGIPEFKWRVSNKWRSKRSPLGKKQSSARS